MDQHVRILAWLFVVYGAILLLIGAMIAFFVVGGGMISGDRTAMLATGGVGIFILCLLFLIAVPNLIAAWGLFRFQPWARILAIILGVLHLFSFPLGTALGVYTLWVLLSAPTQPLFASRATTL
jgi:predicted ferric reductase